MKLYLFWQIGDNIGAFLLIIELFATRFRLVVALYINTATKRCTRIFSAP